MCHLSRLAEFMAYCLSYCFVTSLFYMVSWRQQSARAGGVPRTGCAGSALPVGVSALDCPQSAASRAAFAAPCGPWRWPGTALLDALLLPLQCPAAPAMQIERPERRVHDMLPAEEAPHVDVFICTYSGAYSPHSPERLSCASHAPTPHRPCLILFPPRCVCLTDYLP